MVVVTDHWKGGESSLDKRAAVGGVTRSAVAAPPRAEEPSPVTGDDPNAVSPPRQLRGWQSRTGDSTLVLPKIVDVEDPPTTGWPIPSAMDSVVERQRRRAAMSGRRVMRRTGGLAALLAAACLSGCGMVAGSDPPSTLGETPTLHTPSPLVSASPSDPLVGGPAWALTGRPGGGQNPVVVVPVLLAAGQPRAIGLDAGPTSSRSTSPSKAPTGPSRRTSRTPPARSAR